MIGLWRLFSLRFLVQRKLRAFMAFSSVALGVALFVSTEVANSSVIAAVSSTARELAGKAEWQITRGIREGVAEDLVAAIRAEPGAVASPLVQAVVPVLEPDAGTLLILGVDFSSDHQLRLYDFEGGPDVPSVVRTVLVPGGVIITRTFADRHGLEVGSALRVATRRGNRTLHVTGVFRDTGAARLAQGRFAIMALASAQEHFGRPGYVDRIEVAGVPRSRLEEISPTASIRAAGAAGTLVQQGLDRLRSLIAVGIVALVVAVFIIYNSVSISVVERAKEIATLRAIGASARRIQSLVVLEWGLVGLLASAAGVLVGYGLAVVTLGYVADGVNLLVHVVDIRETVIEPATVVRGMVLGVLSALVASYLPARASTVAAPVDVLRQHGYRLSRHQKTPFFVGLGIFAVSVGFSSYLSFQSLAGFACTALWFVGLALMLPWISVVVAGAVRPWLRRWFRIEGFLGADNLTKFPERTTLTVTALGGGLAMMIASAALIEGFIEASERWVDDAFPFDLALSAADFATAIYTDDVVPGDVLEEVRGHPEVDVAYGVRSRFVPYEDLDVILLAIDIDAFLEAHHLRGLTPWSRKLAEPDLQRRFLAGEGVAVSENFAFRFGVSPGDRVSIPGPDGPRSYPVLLAIEDYSWPFGLICIHRGHYREAWGDDGITYLDMRLEPGADPRAVRQSLLEGVGDRYSVYIYDIAEIRKLARDTLTGMLALGDVQIIIAIAIGFLGIVNTLLMGVLQRRREIGLLRAIGMTRGQIARTLLIEATLIGMVAGGLGIVTGLVGGWVPLRAFTLGISGYSTPVVVPWAHIAGAFLAALIIGAVASVVPARRAASVNVIEAIGYE